MRRIRTLGAIVAVLAVVSLTAVSALPALAWNCKNGAPDTVANRNAGICVLAGQPTPKPTYSPPTGKGPVEVPKSQPTETPKPKEEEHPQPKPKPTEQPERKPEDTPKPKPTEQPKETSRSTEKPKAQPTPKPTQPAGCVPEDEKPSHGDTTPPSKEGFPADDVPCAPKPTPTPVSTPTPTPIHVPPPVVYGPPPTATPTPTPTQAPPKVVTCLKGWEYPPNDKTRCVPSPTPTPTPKPEELCKKDFHPVLFEWDSTHKRIVCIRDSHTVPPVASHPRENQPPTPPAPKQEVKVKQVVNVTQLTLTPSAQAVATQKAAPAEREEANVPGPPVTGTGGFPNTGAPAPSAALAQTGVNPIAPIAGLAGLILLAVGATLWRRSRKEAVQS